MIVYCFFFPDSDRARKHGLDEIIQADPWDFDHHYLFELLQQMTLTHRLNDSYSCLVSGGWCDSCVATSVTSGNIYIPWLEICKYS